MMDNVALREAIVAAARAMNTLGLNQGMSGNISARVGATMVITPTATPYDTLRPEQLPSRPLAGPDMVWSGPLRPSSEWRMHRDILARRPEFGAIVHAHPVHCTALAMMRRGIPPCHYMVAIFGGEDVRCAGYATFGTQALSDLIIGALEDRSACLMANHGMIVCGETLDQAMSRATELEALARQYLACLSAGSSVLLSPSEMADAIGRFAAYCP